jgi:HEAT repeat protein
VVDKYLVSGSSKDSIDMEEFESTLEHLQEPDPPRSALFALSNLHSGSLAQLAEAWPALPVERRIDVISQLVEMSEADFEADFSQVFRLCLDDADPRVRTSAIEGLWEVEDVRLIRPLVRALTGDASALVREAAAISLSRFALRAELGQLQPRLADLIWESLWQAVNKAEEDIAVRRRALESLAYFDRPEVSAAIGRAYRDEDSTMRVSAVFAMGRSTDEEWSTQILDELESEFPEMRYEAARACGELQLAGAVPQLSQMTADLDLEVKLAAIWSLGRIGGPEARRVLDICVEMGDEALIEAAREALDEMDYMEEEIDLDLYNYDSDDDPEDEDELEDGFEFDDLDDTYDDTYGGAAYRREDDDDDDELDYWEDEDPYQ